MSTPPCNIFSILYPRDSGVRAKLCRFGRSSMPTLKLLQSSVSPDRTDTNFKIKRYLSHCKQRTSLLGTCTTTWRTSLVRGLMILEICENPLSHCVMAAKQG